MTAPDTITTLLRHHVWANTKLIAFCTTLSDEQLDSTSIGTFGSIRQTLQHMVTSERAYFTRISTGLSPVRARDMPLLSIVEMVESAQITGAGLLEWADKLQPGEDVPVDWDGEIRQVPKAILYTQALDHAAEHRTQVRAIITGLGMEPPSLDGWDFFEQSA